MNRSTGIVLLVAGIVLLIMGLNAADSLSSEISKFFNGTPTNKSVWLIIGGVAGIVLGLVSMGRGSPSS